MDFEAYPPCDCHNRGREHLSIIDLKCSTFFLGHLVEFSPIYTVSFQRFYKGHNLWTCVQRGRGNNLCMYTHVWTPSHRPSIGKNPQRHLLPFLRYFTGLLCRQCLVREPIKCYDFWELT